HIFSRYFRIPLCTTPAQHCEGYNENVAFGVEDLMHNNPAMKERRIIQDRLMAEMFAGKIHSSMNSAYIVGEVRWTMTGVQVQ
ncbi:hypothetical protein MTR67_043817, partial [Solanum verrucosum]